MSAVNGAVIIVIAFAFVPACFAVFVVTERETGSKHQQLVSGLSTPVYWATTFVWDNLSYFLTAVVSFLIIYAFDIPGISRGGSLGPVAMLLLLYGSASAAFVYAIAPLFGSASQAQNYVLFIFLLGALLMMASSVMATLPSTCKANDALKYIFGLLPGYSMGTGLVQLAQLDSIRATRAQCFGGIPSTDQVQPFDWLGAGKDVTYLAWTTVFYLAIAIGNDYAQAYAPAQRFLSQVAAAIDCVFCNVLCCGRCYCFRACASCIGSCCGFGKPRPGGAGAAAEDAAADRAQKGGL